MRGKEQVAREKGTPQGGVISPLLANLFLHYAFDVWMSRKEPHVPFERYADDVIVHCRSRREAETLLHRIGERFLECGLELNRDKTRIVYCKDAKRCWDKPEFKFTFLGYEFRPRMARNRNGGYFLSFLPAISPEAGKAIRKEIRSWRLRQRSDKSIEELAEAYAPKLRGWIHYYGRFSRSRFYSVFRTLDQANVTWACRKYKKMRGRRRRAADWLIRLRANVPEMWPHWSLSIGRS